MARASHCVSSLLISVNVNGTSDAVDVSDTISELDATRRSGACSAQPAVDDAEFEGVWEADGVGDGDEDGEGVGDGDEDREGVGDGDVDGAADSDAEREFEGVTEMVGVTEGVTDIVGVTDDVTDIVGVTDCEGVTLGDAEGKGDAVMDILELAPMQSFTAIM
jgi:hypothetical protein